MRVDTINFIMALKQRGLIRTSLEDTARKFCRSYYCTDSYDDYTLYRVVKEFFLDFIETADNPRSVMWHFFESKDRGKTDLYAMLSAMQLAEVKNSKGNYVNGFRNV